MDEIIYINSSIPMNEMVRLYGTSWFVYAGTLYAITPSSMIGATMNLIAYLILCKKSFQTLVFFKYLFEFISWYKAISVAVHSCKGFVDVEKGTLCEALTRKFCRLFRLKKELKRLHEKVSCLFGEKVSSIVVFMEIIGFSLAESHRMWYWFRSEGFCKIWIKQSTINISV